MACLSLYRNYYKATLLQSCILCANVTVKAERQTETGAEHSNHALCCKLKNPLQYWAVWQLTKYLHLLHLPSLSFQVSCAVSLSSSLFSPQSFSQSADVCICFYLTFPVSADSIITYLRIKHPIWPKVGILKYLRMSKLAKFNKSELTK